MFELFDFTYDWIQLITLTIIAVASSFMGVFLVYRKITMLANSLSHTILLGLVCVFLIMRSSFFSLGDLPLWALLLASFISAVLTSLLTNFFEHTLGINEGASIGFVFTSLFAIGVLLVTAISRNLHLGTEAIMGNADALHQHDMILGLEILGLTLAVLLVCFRPLKYWLFDAGFSSSIGIPNRLLSYILMLLTAAISIAAFRAVGIFLFLTLLIVPVLVSRLFYHRLRSIFLCSALFSTGIVFLSIIVAKALLLYFQLPISTSGLIVTLMAIAYLGCLTYCKKAAKISTLLKL